MYQANAGDSRSVISVKGEAEALSIDHKPQNEGVSYFYPFLRSTQISLLVEKNRIVAAGGYIEYGRVNG